MSCESQIEPLQLLFSNVTLTNNGQANLNGVALQIGSPEQIIALTPSVLLSNTVLSNRDTCGSNPNVSCIASIGGGFDASASSSFRASTADSWNGSTELNVDYYVNQAATYFNDLFTVAVGQSSQPLPGFPFLLAATKTSAFSELGLGRNSTFIQRLHEARLTPSRSWSFFAGVYSRIQAGLLIIGGYADRFYQGTLITSNVSDVCDFCFEVTSMKYQQDGVQTSLLPDGNVTVMAAIDPYFLTMSVTNDMFYKFGNATNGTLSSIFHSYNSNAVPTGNITVTLGNGLTTVIPNKALFNPPAYDNGGFAPFRSDNSTVLGVFLNSPDIWIEDTATLKRVVFGMPYASMLYLMRDYERQTISIANANQDAQVGGTATPICPLREPSHSRSNHTGAIAGGVVGGIVGLALIVFVIWFFTRRRKKGASSSGSFAHVRELPASKVPTTSDGDTAQDSSTFEKPAGSAKFAQEVSNEGTKFEVAGDHSWQPSEMSAEGTNFRAELPASKEQQV